MDNKTKVGALFLAATVGATAMRLAAAPNQPDMRLIAVTVEPAIVLTLTVRGKTARLQCTDADGAAVKLAGRPFSPADELCATLSKTTADAKASVGLMAEAIDQQLSEK